MQAARRTAGTVRRPFDSFASQKELVELAAGWPAERLVAIRNSLPGVTPVKKFTDHGRYPDLEEYPGAARPWPTVCHLWPYVRLSAARVLPASALPTRPGFGTHQK